MTIDAIMPVFRPDTDLILKIKKIKRQSIPIRKLYLIVSCEDKTEIETRLYKEICIDWDGVQVIDVPIYEFDHAGTRDKWIRKSDADYVLLLSQNADPADRYIIRNLLQAFEEKPDAAIAYARHLPDDKVSIIEKYTQEYYYPDEQRAGQRNEELRRRTALTACSNTCALYQRERYVQGKGFGKKMIRAEETAAVKRAWKNGYTVLYVPKACVVCSRHYGLKELFQKSYDSGVVHREHKQIFSGLDEKETSKNLSRILTSRLIRGKTPQYIPRLITENLFRKIGYRLGYWHRSVPDFVAEKFSYNKYYWS